MPPRKKTSPRLPGLTTDDVAGLRARLGAGEKPRVIVRAASAAVPAGTRGNVIRMGSPADGEFIVVRLGRDEVPFAPAELALSARGASATARAAKSAPARSAAKAPAKAPAKAASKRPVKQPSTRTSTAGRAAPAKVAAAKATKAAPAKTAPAKSASSQPPKPRRSTAKRGSRRGQHPLTVTLRFNDGSWTVEAQRGSRRLARASALRPGAVKAFAEHVDEPAIREAISAIVESGRAVVAERAEKLRAELEAAEASLREYEARRR